MVISAFDAGHVHEFTSDGSQRKCRLRGATTPSQKRPILLEWMEVREFAKSGCRAARTAGAAAPGGRHGDQSMDMSR